MVRTCALGIEGAVPGHVNSFPLRLRSPPKRTHKRPNKKQKSTRAVIDSLIHENMNICPVHPLYEPRKTKHVLTQQHTGRIFWLIPGFRGPWLCVRRNASRLERFTLGLSYIPLAGVWSLGRLARTVTQKLDFVDRGLRSFRVDCAQDFLNSVLSFTATHTSR